MCSIPKEQAGNNFPISQSLGDSPVVPFGQKFVEDNLHGFEPRGTLATGFVCLVEDAHVDLQALGGFCLYDIVFNSVQCVKDDPAACPR